MVLLLVGLSDTDGNHFKNIFDYLEANRKNLNQFTSDLTFESEEKSSCIVKKIKQKQKILNKNEISQLVCEYYAGLSVYQLAKKIGCHRQTISNHLKASGIDMRGRPISDEQIVEAIKLYSSGFSCAKISKLLCVDSKTVYKYLVQRNIVMRDTHGRVRE